MIRTRVGYAGGTTPDPTYQSIGDHTEAVEVDYDPALVSYEELLAVFWKSHQPTSPARSQQYASIIFVRDDAQLAAAEASKRTREASLGTLLTEIVPLQRFYLAEDYHQKYYLRHDARMAEFRELFGNDEAAFRDSTEAARANAEVGGYCEVLSARRR